jgi:cell wall-active antibiotic response 4TMS protein YvqF
VEPLSSAAPPYGAPPAPPRPRRRGGVVGPLILIFLGAVFLLQNTGYLPPNFWLNLWKLWPLVLVLVGIELLLAHRVPWLALAGLAAVVLVLGSITMGMGITPGSGPTSTAASTSTQTDLGGANQAAVTVRFGAGQLDLGPIEQPSQNALASMTYQGPPQLAPKPRYTLVSGGVGQLEYQSTAREGPPFVPFVNGQNADAARMQLNLAPTVPIASLNVQTGATDARLDLSSLRVATLDMSIGAATAWVRFPEAAGLTTGHISGGASTITLEVPQGVAAQIQHHGGLSTLNIDQTRFPQVSESVYRSTDYDTATNKVDLVIETGVTTVTVR